MMIVGSARMDENGKLVNGKAGDQTGKEVSTQEFYVHSKGWNIIRPKSIDHAKGISEAMLAACNNNNIGYDQNQRLGIINHGIGAKIPTECDCSSLVRQCVREATGKDPGDFTTGNEVAVLQKTGLFEKEITFVNQEKTPVYDGDILVTKTKGHTVIVISGNSRKKTEIKNKFEYNGVDYSPVFDAEYYKNNNPDVVKAYGTDPKSLFKHFTDYGIKEGRRGNNNFDVNIYLKNNPDLWLLLYNHYCLLGKNENRKAI